jgi:hypothetical protein
MDTKHILASKTFWVNVVSLAATYSGYLPAEYAAVVVPVANLILRLLTKQPVTVTQ